MRVGPAIRQNCTNSQNRRPDPFSIGFRHQRPRTTHSVTDAATRRLNAKAFEDEKVLSSCFFFSYFVVQFDLQPRSPGDKTGSTTKEENKKNRSNENDDRARDEHG
jgi:hypothetical protein